MRNCELYNAGVDSLNNDLAHAFDSVQIGNGIQNTLIGYEIIDAYQRVILLQYQLAENYLRSGLSWEQRNEMDPLRQSLIANKMCAYRWPDIKAYINRIQERVLQPLINDYEQSTAHLTELIKTFEENSTKAEFMTSIDSLIQGTHRLIANLDNLFDLFNNFRTQLEENVREDRKIIDNTLAKLAREKSNAQLLTKGISNTQSDISHLNQSILKSAYANQINKSFAIEEVGINTMCLFNPIALVTTQQEYSMLPDVLKTQANHMNRKSAELQTSITKLANIKGELAFFNLFCSEFLKFQQSALYAIDANLNIRDSWASLMSNLESIKGRLDKLKNIKPETKEVLIKVYLNGLKNSIKQIKENLELFKKNKLIEIPISKEISKVLKPYSSSSNHFSSLKLSPALLAAYTTRI